MGKDGHSGDAAEYEVPKCSEELDDDGRRLGLVVKWRFGQVVVPSSVVVRDS